MSKFNKAFARASNVLAKTFGDGDRGIYIPASGDPVNTQLVVTHDVEVVGEGMQTSFLATTITVKKTDVAEVVRGDTFQTSEGDFLAEGIYSGDRFFTEVIVTRIT